MVLVPNFILYRLLPHPASASGNWIGTQEPLWVGAFLGGAFGTFLLRQFFLAIPRELADAARVDGANPWQIYRHIYLPLAKPALATLAIFTFMWTWNDLIDPIIYLRDIDSFTLTAGLSLFQGQYVGKWPLLMAGALVSVIPMIILFVDRPAPLRPGDRDDRDQGLTVAGVDGLPLYRRIEADLRDRIRAGELAPGARVETELELMERYGVSRATVRQALGGLIAAGRPRGPARPRDVRGRGALRAHDRRLLLVQPGDRAARPAARDAGPRARGRAGRGERSPLRSGSRPGPPVVALRRIRLADDEPLVVETSRLPAARFPGLERVDFATVRLYDTLTTTYGCRPTRARETFEPILLTAAEAGLLGQRRGEPGAAGRARSPWTRTTSRSSTAGARSAATAIVTPWSCATDDRPSQLRAADLPFPPWTTSDVARGVDLRRGDRGRARRPPGPRAGDSRRCSPAPSGSS